MREYPVHHMWYGKGAGRTIEEIIDWKPDYFIWLVQTFLDVTPSQAAYFKKKLGMDLPREVIRDVVPYIHHKLSPPEEYERICKTGFLPPDVKAREVPAKKSSQSRVKAVSQPKTKKETNKSKTKPDKARLVAQNLSQPKARKTENKVAPLKLVPTVPESSLEYEEPLDLTEEEEVANPYAGFYDYVVGRNGLIIRETMCPAMREYFRNKRLEIIEPNLDFEFEGPQH